MKVVDRGVDSWRLLPQAPHVEVPAGASPAERVWTFGRAYDADPAQTFSVAARRCRHLAELCEEAAVAGDGPFTPVGWYASAQDLRRLGDDYETRRARHGS